MKFDCTVVEMIIDLLKRVDDMLRMTEERCIFLMFNFKGQGQLDILIKEKNYFNHGIHVHCICYTNFSFTETEPQIFHILFIKTIIFS